MAQLRRAIDPRGALVRHQVEQGHGMGMAGRLAGLKGREALSAPTLEYLQIDNARDL